MTLFISFVIKKEKKMTDLVSVRFDHSLSFRFLNPMISLHRHHNEGQSLNVGLGSFGRRYSRDGVFSAGQLG